MAYVGNPIDTTNTFQSLVGKRFNGDASTTAFTLDVAPSSTLDIEVFVENVRQDPNSAYSLSGTTLTFAAAPPSGTNNIYVVHQAKAVGTISPAAGTVNADSFDNTVISGHTALATTPATTDEFLVSDAGTIKRVDFSLMGNTPCFYRQKIDSQQTFATGTATKITFNNEVLDSDSKMTNTTFTPTVVGYYNIFASWGINTSSDVTQMKCMIYKNGSVYATNHEYSTELSSVMVNTIVYLDADDYVEAYAEHNRGSDAAMQHDNATTFFGGFKLIGV